MKLLTHNTNKLKLGADITNQYLSENNDIICLQRFDIKLLDELDLSGRHWHFTPSFPNQPNNTHMGLLSIWRQDLDPHITDVAFETQYLTDEEWQGNSYCMLSFPDHVVVNCLVSGYEQDQDIWTAQVNEVLAHDGHSKSIIVGDFHAIDMQPLWQNIRRRGHQNMAGHINAFKNPRGFLSSLTKVLVRDLTVSNVFHGADIFARQEWDIIGAHWPVGAIYDI